MKAQRRSFTWHIAASGVALALCGLQSAYAGNFQTVFVSVNGTEQVCPGNGGPPPFPVPSSAFTNSGGTIQIGCSGPNSGSAIYGTFIYNVVWVPANGKTVQQDPPPPTYSLMANVCAGASTMSTVYHPQNYVYTFDGFPNDLQNNPPAPGNPADPWYFLTNSGTYYITPCPITLWNLDILHSNPMYTSHTFTNAYPGPPIVFNFAVANPAAADNNTASWDTNPYKQPGASWPCYTVGDYALGQYSTYSIQLSIK